MNPASSHPTVTPYGQWRSPLTPTAMGTIGFGGIGQVEVDGAGVYWTEARSADNGRTTIVMRAADGTTTELLPAPFDTGTRVHEFGGRSFAVDDSIVWFSDRTDDRIYRVVPGGTPERVAGVEGLRYADFCVDSSRGLLFSVAEDHRAPGEARNYLVSVSLDTGETTELTGGYDFYGAPRLSPDGRCLAWVCWRHPNMPWDGTELWVADVAADGALIDPRPVAGGSDESVVAPRWAPDRTLCFISDRNGLWTLYRWDGAETTLVGPADEEAGGFLRILNNNGYGIAGSGRIWYVIARDGLHHVVTIDPDDGAITEIETPYTYITDVHPQGDGVVFVGASATAGQTVVHLGADGTWSEVRPRPDSERLPVEWISVPEPITFPTTGGAVAHAFLYRPINPDHQAPQGDLPPLVVNIHGGPVWAAFGYYQPEVQFFTTHGFACLDVNYRGSVGFGRAYRRALYGQWGVVDVDDAVAGARYVVERGLADPDRIAIRGPSAGGWTTLAALAFTDFFAAGMSSFGVSDPERFVLPGGTHKYESRYLLELIAPYPEGKAIFDARSPIRSAGQITNPLLLLQGLDDMVVLPEQSRLIADALRANDVMVELLEFPGEGHGFRQAAHIERAFQAELSFMGRVHGARARA